MTQTRPLTELDRAAFELAIKIASEDSAHIAVASTTGSLPVMITLKSAARRRLSLPDPKFRPAAVAKPAVLSHHERVGPAPWRRRCET